MHCPTLKELPLPPQGKTGWPWTQESPQLPDTMPDCFPWPRISIVTPSYNQGRFIEETIRSVLLQGYPNLEYVIIDGGSTDNTLEIIRKYEKWIYYWVSEKDSGQAHAVNKGFKIHSGDICGWLNSDDVYAQEAFSSVSFTWFNSDQPSMIYGDAVSTDITLRPYSKKVMKNYSLETMILGKSMPQPSVFFSKGLFDKIGPLDEDLFYNLDFEFFFRAWSNNYAEKFFYLPRILAYSRVYAETKCNTGGWRRIEEKVGVLKRSWNKHLLFRHNPTKWRPVFAIAFAALARQYLENGRPNKALSLYVNAYRLSKKTACHMLMAIPHVIANKILRPKPPWLMPDENRLSKNGHNSY